MAQKPLTGIEELRLLVSEERRESAMSPLLRSMGPLAVVFLLAVGGELWAQNAERKPRPVFSHKGAELRINVPLESIAACRKMEVPLFGKQRVPFNDRFCWSSTETLRMIHFGSAVIPPGTIELVPPKGYVDADFGAVYGLVHEGVLVRVEVPVWKDAGKEIRKIHGKATRQQGNVEEWLTPDLYIRWTAIHMTQPPPPPEPEPCFNTYTGQQVDPSNCVGIFEGMATATTALAVMKKWMVPNLLIETREYHDRATATK